MSTSYVLKQTMLMFYYIHVLAVSAAGRMEMLRKVKRTSSLLGEMAVGGT